MKERRKFIVIEAHVSEFPRPIAFAAGALLVVGEKYIGPEGWDRWYFCETPGQQVGWVHARGGPARRAPRPGVRGARTSCQLDVVFRLPPPPVRTSSDLDAASTRRAAHRAVRRHVPRWG